ncbi:MAG: helix-turn-helix transcriptional regulator [Clostridia bacterium]|nr:helix-turn-helix transcriptional regulator [Clostridia bacterium]
MLDAVRVGKILQHCRESRGLSQEIVSGLAGIGRTHLSALERGRRCPTLDTFLSVVKAIGMEPSEVIAIIEAEAYKSNDRAESNPEANA